MKEQTNPKSKGKRRVEETETETVIVPGEQGDEGRQAKESVPVSKDEEQKPSSESPVTGERESRRGRQGDDEQFSIPAILPVLPLKDTVVYPFAVQPLGVGQERSVHLIDDVMQGNRMVVLVAQKSADIEQAGPDDIFTIGNAGETLPCRTYHPEA
jgi:ATP-dependent Lon protease